MAGKNIEQLNVKVIASADDAVKAIDKMIKTVNNFKTTYNTTYKQVTNNSTKISNSIKQTVTTVNQLNISFKEAGSSAKGFSGNLSGITSGLKGIGGVLSNSIHGIIGLIPRILAIGNAFKKLYTFVQLSNKYVEDYNLFTVALGEYADEAERYANKVSELMGIDPAQWMRNQGVFNTIIKGFGVAGDRAYTMSQQLTQLGYDISSFYNIDVEEAMTKLTSGISGELEPLRRLGYDLSVARLEQDKTKVTFEDSAKSMKTLEIALDDLTLSQEALNRGITKSVADMTQAEKAQLRYYSIMTQVTDAQGDMSRTLEAPANQLRVLSAQFTMLGREIGNIFIPALNKMLPYIIATTKALRELASWLASLVGYEMPEIDYSSTNTVAQIEDIEDSFDNATSKAKEFKKFLLGIDELNIIPTTNGGNRANSGDDTGGWMDFDLPTYDFIGNASQTRVNEIYKKIVDLFKNNAPEEIGNTIKDWIVTGLDKIPWAEIQEGAHKVGEKFAKFLNGLLSPSDEEEKGLGEGIGGAVGGALGTIGNLFTGFFENAEFDKWAENLGQFLSSAFENINIDFSKLLGGKDGDNSGLGDWLAGEIEGIKDNAAVLAAVGLVAVGLGSVFGEKFMGAAIVAIGAYEIGSIISKAIDDISGDEHYEGGFFAQMNEIKKSFTDGSWKQAVLDWGKDIYAGFDTFAWQSNPAKWAMDLTSKIFGYEPSSANTFVEFVLERFNYLGEAVWPIIEGLGERIAENNEKVRQNIITTLASIKVHWLNLKNGISETVSGITSKVEQFGLDVKDFLQPIIDTISNIGAAFTALAKLDFSSLGNFANLNEGGTGLLDIISKYLNKNSYATGGFPEDGLFMANHGELVGSFSNGRTAVANNDQIVAGIEAGVRSAVLSALSSSGIVEAVMSGKSINIDGREIMNVVVNQNNRAINRTGVSPIRT